MHGWFLSLLMVAAIWGNAPAKPPPRGVLALDCSDGSWALIKTEKTFLQGLAWGIMKVHVKIVPPAALGCVTVSLLWENKRPIYQTWGTHIEQHQSLRLDNGWTPPVRGSKMQYTLVIDRRERIVSVTLALYDGEESDIQAVSKAYANPMIPPPMPETISAPTPP